MAQGCQFSPIILSQAQSVYLQNQNNKKLSVCHDVSYFIFFFLTLMLNISNCMIDLI